MKKFEFTSEIKKVPEMNGAYVEIPLDVKAEFGKGRVLVHATFDGEPYDGQVVKMGTPCHILGMTKMMRDKIGKTHGDLVKVTIEERSPAMPKHQTVEQYIAAFDGEVKERMIKMRALILSCSPLITEKISWGMPTFVLNGNLVHFSAEKKHLGFHPEPSAIEAFYDRLGEYKKSKGTVQFPYDKPMPYELIEEMVLFRVASKTTEK